MFYLKDFNKTAIAYDNKDFSYKDVIIYADIYSRLTSQHILVKNTEKTTGSRIAIFFENRPEWAFLIYGIWKAEGVALPMDFMSTPDEISFIIDNSGMTAIYVSNKSEKQVQDALLHSKNKPQIINIDKLQISNSNSSESYPEMMENAVAVIIYTSGTTGSPKGVMLTFGNIWANIEVLSTDKFDKRCIMYAPDETYIAILPFHHIYPLQGTLLGPLSAGSTVCMIKEITADAVFNTCQKYNVTRILGIPRLYEMFHKGIMNKVNASLIGRSLFRISSMINSRKISSVIFASAQKKFGGHIRALMSGGSKLDENIAKAFHALGFRVLEGYGMTETSPSMTMCDLERYKLGSVGYAIPCGEIRIIETELCFKGPNVMKGYFNNPDATASVFDTDGWFHTGDKAEIDSNGFVKIIGRIKDIIILPNGKNINPEEIEKELITAFPLIKEVGLIDREGILFAVIFPDFNLAKKENIINLRETIKWEILDKYNQKAAHHKKILDFDIVETELPRTRIGKLKRFALSDLLVSRKKETSKIAEPDTEEYRIFSEMLEELLGRKVNAGDHFELDLNMDSLDRVELQVQIETNFGITLTNEDISNHPRIADLADFIASSRTKIENEKTDWYSILNQKISFKIPTKFFMMRIMLLLTKPVRTFYFRIKAEGIENIPQNTPVIFAPNHSSYLDGLAITSILKRRLRKSTYFFAKDRNFKSSFKRFFARNANIILLNINKDLKETLQQFAAISKAGKNVIIFPEGARSRDGKIGKFKKSFAIISKELNVPVVPVVIDGTFNLFSIGSKIPKPGKIKIKFLKPISSENYNYDEITELTFNVIRDNLQHTDEKPA